MKATIDNVGPIQSLTIDIPDGGGVVELLGANGSGKSAALSAMASVLAGKGAVPVRDGESAAVVDAFGVTLKCGKSTRRTGEMEVYGISGKLDVGDLVEGNGIDDPAKADVWRIRALVSMKQIEADVTKFYDLIGGQAAFESYVPPVKDASEDPVSLAGRVKRAFHAGALTCEGQASHERGHEASLKESSAKVDIKAESDPGVLQTLFAAAVASLAMMKAQAKQYSVKEAERAEARKHLEAFTAGNTGPNEPEAALAAERARAALADSGAAVAAAKAALLESQNTHALREKDAAAADAALRACQRHTAMLAGWQASLEAPAVPQVTEAEIDAGGDAVEAAREALERGALVRKALVDLETAKAHATKAKALEAQAAKLREAAHGTDDVLNKLVKSPRFRVESVDNVPRLVVSHARGQSVPYSELSPGERWTIALEEAIEIVVAAESRGKPAVLIASQVAWEGLDDSNRANVDRICRASRVTLFTARPHDGPLHAAQFEAAGR